MFRKLILLSALGIQLFGYSLTIQTTPSDARVRIMNINPKYYDGIDLENGRYLIYVDKSGLTTFKKWIEINSDISLKVNLYSQEINIASSKYENIKIQPTSQDKIFIREYTYLASENDSKNSSRRKAIEELKLLLSQEVGTHIENYLEIEEKNVNGVTYTSINSEIKSLSSSITKLKILDENWNGRKYWIKASVRINEKRTIELILEALKSKASEKDVKRLNKILAEQKRELENRSSEVSDINKKLVSQEIVNEARKNEVLKMKKELVKFQEEELLQKKEEEKYSSELERKKALIKKLNKKTKNKVEKMKKEWLAKVELLCSFDIGTSKKDIEEIAGVRFSSYNPKYHISTPSILRLKLNYPYKLEFKFGYRDENNIYLYNKYCSKFLEIIEMEKDEKNNNLKEAVNLKEDVWGGLSYDITK